MVGKASKSLGGGGLQASAAELIWDFTIAKSVDKKQLWVLSAMQRYGQELINMLWRILGDEQDVCDAYQNTFLQLAHREGGQKPKHIKAYLFRTASNVAISILRHKIAERKKLSAIADLAYQQKGANNISTNVAVSTCQPAIRLAVQPQKSVSEVENQNTNETDFQSLAETLRSCIARLPEHLRNVVTLHDLGELPYAQVAKMLNISVATARVYRCKAIQLLTVWMNKYESEK